MEHSIGGMSQKVPFSELFVGMVLHGTICRVSPKGVFVAIGSAKRALLACSGRVGERLRAGDMINDLTISALDQKKRTLKVSAPYLRDAVRELPSKGRYRSPMTFSSAVEDMMMVACRLLREKDLASWTPPATSSKEASRADALQILAPPLPELDVLEVRPMDDCGITSEVTEGLLDGFSLVALKKYRSSRNIEQELRHEADLLMTVRHPGIVSLYGTALCRSALVLEHMYGNMKTFLHESPNAPLAPLFVGALTGLQFCHHLEIVHRDIRLVNILVGHDRCTTKLCDFGFACKLPASSDVMLSVPYLPRDVLQGGAYEREDDIYQVAVTLLDAMKGDAWAESGVPSMGLMQHILDGGLPIHIPEVVTNLDAIVLTALSHNRADRPDARRVIAMLFSQCQEQVSHTVEEEGSSPRRARAGA